MNQPWHRRPVLRTLGAALLPAAATAPRRGLAMQPRRLLIAGGPGGRLARWVVPLAAALQRGDADGGEVTVELDGGDDGVTGANRFQAEGPSDTTALLIPGAAAAAWLAGDPRVQFDAARWLPLLCGLSDGMLAGRRALADADPQQPLRIVLADPLGPGAACLLGLDLLSVAARPVMQPQDDPAGAAAALRSGRADAAFIAGSFARAAAAAVGAMPLLTLGPPDAAGPGLSEPAPSLRAMLAAAAPRAPALLQGWTAAAAAVQIDFALVVSSLADAGAIAAWREAATAAAVDPAVLGISGGDVRCVAAPGCTDVLAAVTIPSAGLLDYRRWLSTRLGYQPG